MILMVIKSMNTFEKYDTYRNIKFIINERFGYEYNQDCNKIDYPLDENLTLL